MGKKITIGSRGSTLALINAEKAKDAIIKVKWSFGSVVLMRIIAPKITIQLIALAPDISGVCRPEGTFDITSNPSKMVNNNRYIRTSFVDRKLNKSSIF